MFAPGYVVNELRRRSGRTITTAIGLAAGVGLVMSIVGVSNGLSVAQTKLLSPLSSVGTDIIITRTQGTQTTTTTAAATPTAAPTTRGGFPGGGGQGGGFFSGGNSKYNSADASALTSADGDGSILTDLSKLGPAGTNFIHDFFVPGTLITFPSVTTAVVDKIPDVTGVVGALSMQAIHESGTVPKITATYTTGAQNISVTTKPPAMTAAEQSCLQSYIQSHITSTPTTGTPPSPGGGTGHGGGGGFSFSGGGGAFTAALDACDPALASYQQNVVVPSQTITQILNPPSTNTQTKTYTVAGVNPTVTDQGVITKAQVVKGTWFTSTPADEILVNSAYANTNAYKVGQTLSINSTNFKIVGIVSPTLSGDVSDIYFDLATLESQSSQPSRVNEVLVSVAKSSDVNSVAAAIKKAIPGATVVTDADLAKGVTGSLADASSIAGTLGTALAVIVLVASFLIAILLTLSSISKRVREIGSLRAMGWKKGQVVRQIMAETIAISIVGAIVGIGVGYAISLAVGGFGPSLQAQTPGAILGNTSASSALSVGGTGGTATAAIQYVHLTAPIDITIILLGIGAALVGGILAGAIGGWRAARMAPALALRDLG